jgi:hypothetical protein
MLRIPGGRCIDKTCPKQEIGTVESNLLFNSYITIKPNTEYLNCSKQLQNRCRPGIIYIQPSDVIELFDLKED